MLRKLRCGILLGKTEEAGRRRERGGDGVVAGYPALRRHGFRV